VREARVDLAELPSGCPPGGSGRGVRGGEIAKPVLRTDPIAAFVAAAPAASARRPHERRSSSRERRRHGSCGKCRAAPSVALATAKPLERAFHASEAQAGTAGVTPHMNGTGAMGKN